MYKILLMIKDSANDELIKYFRNDVIIHLEKAAGVKIQLGDVDGAKLNPEPYIKICEIVFKTKDEMDKALSTPDGKKFNRNLTSFIQHVSVFFIDYGV